MNDPQDVGLVQHLLNSSRASRGVPKERLKVDGIVGPKTLAAIREFQSRFCTVVDGRVDPYRETITQLNRAAHPFVSLNNGKEYLVPDTDYIRIA